MKCNVYIFLVYMIAEFPYHKMELVRHMPRMMPVTVNLFCQGSTCKEVLVAVDHDFPRLFKSFRQILFLIISPSMFRHLRTRANRFTGLANSSSYLPTWK